MYIDGPLEQPAISPERKALLKASRDRNNVRDSGGHAVVANLGAAEDVKQSETRVVTRSV